MVYPEMEVTFYDLKNIDLGQIVEPTILKIHWDGAQFDFLLSIKKSSDKAVVFGTGDFDRTKRELPFFYRNSWTDDIDCNTIFYSDPTLYLTDKTGICWCYGTKERWYLKEIAVILKMMFEKLHVDIKDTLFFGSSGGGYTAICLATLLRGKATVINPQFIVENHWPKDLKRLKETCLSDGEELIQERVDISKLIELEGYMPPIHLLQNIAAERDLVAQLNPFIEKLSSAGILNKTFRVDYYYDKKGHNGMPGKDECIRIINEDISSIFSRGDTIEKNFIMESNNKSKLYLILTIDTEDKHSTSPNLIECDFGDAGNCGVNYIMEQFEKRNMHGVFFVNIYEHANYTGEWDNYIEKLLVRISKRGHEVALHTHQDGCNMPIYPNQLYACNYDQQYEIIKYGSEFIKKYTGKYPVSHRGGGYRCNEITFDVLRNLGYKVDSSVYYSNTGTGNRFRYFNALNQVTDINGLIEFPVINAFNNNGDLRKLDPNSMTAQEIIDVIEQMKKREDFNAAQLMFHSFSFIEQKTDNDSISPFWIAGAHPAYGVSKQLTERFETILDYLYHDPDIEVVTFEEYMAMNLSIPSFWGDGVFSTKTNKSQKAALNFKAEQFNKRSLNGTSFHDVKKGHYNTFGNTVLSNIPKMYYSDSECIVKADSILNGTLYVYSRIEGLPFELDRFDWNIQHSNIPTTFQLYLQALNPLQILTRAFELTKNTVYLKVAYQFLLSWKSYSDVMENRRLNRFIFSDHSVALRSDNLIYFGKVCSNHAFWNDGLFETIHSILSENGKWLADEKNYTRANNHGVMQDCALLHIGVCLKNDEFINLAKQRLEIQKKAAFNEEYVHTENSPGYAGIVKNLFLNAAKFLKDNGDSFGENLINDMAKTQEYINWTTKPNGILAQVGDTNNQQDVYLIPKGTARKFDEPHKIYPKTGQYFYRSDWDDLPQNDTWKMVKSGYCNLAHKHADDLSFMLYSKGYEIFADTGIYGYKKDDYRSYFISALAHNTIIVDEQSYPISKENMQNVGMQKYKFEKEYDSIILFNNSYKNVNIVRQFCSSGDLTVLFDTMESGEYHTYSQLFHCSEHMKLLSQSDNQVELEIADTGHKVFIMQFALPLRLNVLQGIKDLPLYGLISRCENHFDTITTLKFDTAAQNGRFITAIAIAGKDGNIRLNNGVVNISELQYHAENSSISIGDVEISYDNPGEYINLKEVVDTTETIVNGNNLTFKVKIKPQYEGKVDFAYYLYCETTIIKKIWYIPESQYTFTDLPKGNYKVQYYLRHNEDKVSFFGNTVTVK